MAESDAPKPSEESPKSSYERGRSRLLRRVVPLLIVAGLATWFFQDTPKETTLEYDLQVPRDGLTALNVDVVELPNRALVRHVEYRFSPSSPAPEAKEHKLKLKLKLKSGQYEIDATLDYGEGRRLKLVRTFPFNGEERVTVPLRP